MSMLSNTTKEMILYVPNMVAPTNSVNTWSGWTLVTYKLINPKMDQKRDWRVSKSLEEMINTFNQDQSSISASVVKNILKSSHTCQ